MHYPASFVDKSGVKHVKPTRPAPMVSYFRHLIMDKPTMRTHNPLLFGLISRRPRRTGANFNDYAQIIHSIYRSEHSDEYRLFEARQLEKMNTFNAKSKAYRKKYNEYKENKENKGNKENKSGGPLPVTAAIVQMPPPVPSVPPVQAVPPVPPVLSLDLVTACAYIVCVGHLGATEFKETVIKAALSRIPEAHRSKSLEMKLCILASRHMSLKGVEDGFVRHVLAMDIKNS